MALSKSAVLSVLVTLALAYFGFQMGIAFLVGAIGVTLAYRGIKGCFNFVNPMALTGSGAVVLVLSYTHDVFFAFLGGMLVSMIVGLLYPG